MKTVIVPLAKTRLGLDINQDGGHKTKIRGKTPIKDSKHQIKGGVDQRKGEKYGLGKSDQPELGNRDNSHRDLILATSRKVLGWMVPRDELNLINGALPLGSKALAPGSCLITTTTTTSLPRSSCLGGIVGSGMRVFHHHVMVVKHGGAAGTDIGLRKSLLMA